MNGKTDFIKCPKCGVGINVEEILNHKIGTKQIWSLPVNLGDSKASVYLSLGGPAGSMKDCDWFENSGMSITYDKFERVTEIIVHGVWNSHRFLPYLDEVIYGLKVTDTLDRFKEGLGKPMAIKESEDDVMLKWRKTPYMISAEFWIKDFSERDQTFPAKTLRTLHLEKGLGGE